MNYCHLDVSCHWNWCHCSACIFHLIIFVLANLYSKDVGPWKLKWAPKFQNLGAHLTSKIFNKVSPLYTYTFFPVLMNFPGKRKRRATSVDINSKYHILTVYIYKQWAANPNQISTMFSSFAPLQRVAKLPIWKLVICCYFSSNASLCRCKIIYPSNDSLENSWIHWW